MKRSFNPLIAIAIFSQTLALIFHHAVPLWTESFATITNIAFVLCAVYAHFADKTKGGLLLSPTFPLLFVGCVSFAFHYNPTSSQQVTIQTYNNNTEYGDKRYHDFDM